MSRRPLSSARLLGLLALLAALLGTTLVTPATAAGDPRQRPSRGDGVTSRPVGFELGNTADALLACRSDGRLHRVRARLVGPTRDVVGRGGSIRINVLVHDAGTGGWFWNLHQKPAYDYATQLAKRGETSLVIDRLGYDRSPLRNGDGTCLDAQVHMVHQVVQHLYSGVYRSSDGRGSLPHASFVVLHGHGTGATIAQLEASRYDDVQGVVLMSAPRTSPTRLALDAVRQQLTTCLGRADYAAFGPSAKAYRALLFRTAPGAVRAKASALRNPTPCGDVLSLASTIAAASSSAGDVQVPVLVLSGARDARSAPMTAAQARAAFTGSRKVTAAVVPKAGSALPLERNAAATRARVLRWLQNLGPRV